MNVFVPLTWSVMILNVLPCRRSPFCCFLLFNMIFGKNGELKGVAVVILYDLKCKNGHEFEGWFKDRQAFEEQEMQRLIACPVCGSNEAEVLLSPPRIVNREGGGTCRKNPREINQLKLRQMFQQYLDENFDDVGERFAEAALDIHHGKEDPRNIKGTTTRQEEELLKEEGVKFIKIPLPKLDS